MEWAANRPAYRSSVALISSACISSHIVTFHDQSFLLSLHRCVSHCCSGTMFSVVLDASCIHSRIPRLCVGKRSVSPTKSNMANDRDMSWNITYARAADCKRDIWNSVVTHWKRCADWIARKSWTSHCRSSHDNLARLCTVLYTRQWSCGHHLVRAHMKRGRCACGK